MSFSPGCEHALADYPWPGNLRELRNAVERATILCPSLVIEAADLGIPVPTPGDSAAIAGSIRLGADITLEEIEREHLARVVARAASFEAAARALGIDVTTLQRKRQKYGLS